ncbi:MAG: hypothetical protein U5K54_13690 [Cytophagales bacterium]|nr:hypothetical protein [Cytophagales bacterium]
MYRLFSICVLRLATGSSYKSPKQNRHYTSQKHNQGRLNLLIGSIQNSLVFTYERVVNPHQTWSVSAGLQSLPIGPKLDLIRSVGEIQSSGYKMAGEYRFYLKRRTAMELRTEFISDPIFQF